jgi:hypothetical protein
MQQMQQMQNGTQSNHQANMLPTLNQTSLELNQMNGQIQNNPIMHVPEPQNANFNHEAFQNSNFQNLPQAVRISKIFAL